MKPAWLPRPTVFKEIMDGDSGFVEGTYVELGSSCSLPEADQGQDEMAIYSSVRRHLGSRWDH